MRALLAALYIITTIGVCFAAFIITVMSLKEGAATSDLIPFAILIGVLIVNILLGWVIKRNNKGTWLSEFCTVFIVITLIPILIIGFITLNIFKKTYYGHWMENKASISNYQESLMTWPTFQHPVGLKVELTVPANFISKNGRFGDLIVWHGSFDSINESNFFNVPLDFPVLKPVLFNRFDNSPADRVSGEQILLTRYLYPASVEYIENQNAFCKREYGKQAHTNYDRNQSIHAGQLWHYGHTTAFLTKGLSPLSIPELHNNTTLWLEMHNQFTDDNLLAAGFKRCRIQMRNNCFCK